MWSDDDLLLTFQRFLPSEYGNDVDHVHAVEPAKSVFAVKARIRRAIEAEGIPYTYVSSNFFAGRFLPSLGQAGVTGLPTDKVTIFGDGNVKGNINHYLLTVYTYFLWVLQSKHYVLSGLCTMKVTNCVSTL